MTTGPVTSDDLAAAVAGCGEALRAGVDADGSVAAGVLDWSCRDTAEHLADDLFCYAVQLAPPPVPADRMVAFACLPREPDGPELSVRADPGAGAPGLLEIIAAAGALLVAMVTVAPAGRRGHHVYGPADAEASAAMGIIETVVHAHDIARGLDVAYRPDPGICARTLARSMPAVDPGDDPWEALLRATGRRGDVGPWRWWTEPYCP